MKSILGRFAAKLNRSSVESQKLIAVAIAPSGHVVSSAVNMRATNGRVSKWTVHAEEALAKKIRKTNAIRRFGPLIVIVSRYTSRRGWTMARPCSQCMVILKNCGAKKICYTDWNGNIQYERIN